MYACGVIWEESVTEILTEIRKCGKGKIDIPGFQFK